MCLILQNLLNVQNKREHPNQVKEFVETVVPGGASIPLRRRCSSTTCLLNGSSCPAHASPSVSADCSEPTQECRSPACRVASRRGCPGDLCMTPRTCCLSVLAHGVPVCPAGRIDRPDSFSDQKQKVGLPSHSAPQPWLEASVMTTILLCAMSNITLCFSQKRSLQWARADTQARVTVSRWRPWHQEADGTLCFSQNWIGCMWSRPNKTTGEAAAIWPSILWKALSGRVVASSKEAAWCWIVMVCLQSPPQLVQTGCLTKPEHGGRELCPPLSSPSSWARGGALTLSGWTSNARWLGRWFGGA